MKKYKWRLWCLSMLTCYLLISCGQSRIHDKDGILLFENLESRTETEWSVPHNSWWVPFPERVGPIMYFRNTKYYGPIIQYYENGHVKFRGNYQSGLKRGDWKYYDSKGQLEKEEFIPGFKLDEYKRKEYHEDGSLMSEYIEKDEDTIFYREFYKNGQLAHELKHDKKRYCRKWTEQGELYELYNEDSIVEIKDPRTLKLLKKGYFNDGRKIGNWIKYNSNGSKRYDRNYSDNRRVGKNIEYHRNGKIHVEANYNNNGYKAGTYKKYFEEGELEEAGRYDSKGRKIGRWIKFLSAGKKEKVENYKYGKLDGPYEDYFFEGGIREKSNYKLGELHGSCKRYHPNGKLRAKGNYFAGGKVGIWYYYDDSGNLEKKVNQDE